MGVFRVAGYFVGYLLIYGKEVINVAPLESMCGTYKNIRLSPGGAVFKIEDKIRNIS